MRNKYNILFLFGITAFNFISCDNLIEPDQPTNQISSTDVYSNVGNADAVLSNLYAELQYNSVLSGGTRGLGALLGSYADDLDNYMAASQTAYLDIYNTQVLPTNTVLKTLWTNAYKEIYICNSIIEGVSKSSSIKDEDKNRIIGEAVLIRSIIHLRLTQIFGDIPYVTSSDYTINQSIGKSASGQVLMNIINDLETVKDYLKNDYRNAERIYPNRYIAVMLLCQSNMLLEQWEKARMYAEEIIASPLYQLNTDLNLTFKKDGKHIMWQLKPLKAGDATEEAKLYLISSVPQNYALSNNLVSTFTSTDLRKSLWIKTITSGSNTYYGSIKYKNSSSNTNEYSIVFRIEEVYCMMAEILARQNNVSDALTYINKIRNRAGLANISNTISKDQLLNEILAEKRREFFTDGGLRFFDLKRFDRLGDLSPNKPNWQNFRSLWPIPQSELILNPNLNPQNPGY
ncbi:MULTISPECIES: RagB/SusD family nutrient uptake outer membrane protein [Chryseobacterium]|uniref:SusD family n=4 Tax=Chryseobacterium TaxID=59732 RepID=A0A3S4R0Q1_CHRGE|nr:MULTISPECIES: RagB/SusD family nutrient uptake outer membrane protein [Chryseobacterium]PZU14332.1 MAG: RagB/SusD family nutrient uptake outer membrane protein [Chryseobacterium sp.]ASE61653.1 RagB/SusD family nutrient uptake outer membrane protein [Chryseobacterium indologenes]AZB32287.1 RagB/SusD family nutrient uptake outer membrane protein [Chryseobacterium bernardetii]EFK33968.1 SusD family protein [Chryseobacterium gleum ATCC 35910]MDG4654169.1 RagB/SusD family nutrient uptake outer m